MGQVSNFAKASVLDLFGQSTAPASPPVNQCRMYYNSTNDTFHVIDSNGVDLLGAGGSPAFGSITSGTSAATLVIGTGGSLSFSGTGIVNANEINGIVITGVPTNTQVLTATSGTTANWQTPAVASSAWSALTNATGNLTLANAGFTTEFDQTGAVVWLWNNTTVATVSTTNASPLHELAANYWTGAASAQDLWTVGSSLAAGTNGVSKLSFVHTGSTGGAVVNFPNGGKTSQSIAIGPISGNGGYASIFNFPGTQSLCFQAGTNPQYDAVLVQASRWAFTSGISLGWTTSSTDASGGLDAGLSRISAGLVGVGNGTQGDFSASLKLGAATLTSAAPTVAAAQVSFGSTTSVTIGANGGAQALSALPVGYLVINVAGTIMKVPYYNN